MGHGILTGQVAPPAERYNLREDLAAWAEAIRGLRDNPLVTHLRLAERRRLARSPRWRRNLPVTLTATALATLSLLLLRGWMTTNFAPPSLVLIVQFAVFTCIIAAILLMHGVYNCVVEALSVLGRHNKRSNNLCLDDSTCLSSLSDHEIVTGALSILLPPLFMRVALISLGVCVFPVWFWYYTELRNQQFSVEPPTLGFLLALAIYGLTLALQVALCAILGSTGLVLYFLCLGRGLQTERILIVSGVSQALAQGIYPILLCTITWEIDRGNYDYYGGTISLLLIVLSSAILIFPLMIALVLGWSRRNIVIRYNLAIFSPILMWLIAWPLTLVLYGVCDTTNDYTPGTFMEATAHSLVLSCSSISVLSPVLIINPYGFDNAFSKTYGSYVISWLSELSLIMCVRVSFVILMQILVVYILSRFAREAVRARRSRGE